MGFRYLPGRARRIVVGGPLEMFADGLRQDLAGRGYALDTVTDHVHRLADLSGWLAGRGLTAEDLTGEVAGQFLRERRAAGFGTGVSARAFAPVLGFLREVGAAPPPGPPVLVTELDVLLAAYQRYLEAERSLSAGTVGHYLRYARVFLAGLPGPLGQVLAGLSAGQVTGYVLDRARRRPGGRRRTWWSCPRCGRCCVSCMSRVIPGFRWRGWSRPGGAGSRACRARRPLMVCTRSCLLAIARARAAAVIMRSSWP
jgi:hypothetical protein